MLLHLYLYHVLDLLQEVFSELGSVPTGHTSERYSIIKNLNFSSSKNLSNQKVLCLEVFLNIKTIFHRNSYLQKNFRHIENLRNEKLKD